MIAPTVTERKPCRWATYPGDCRGNPGLVVGPNTFGELLHIVTEAHDPETDKTRVGFAYGPPLTSGVQVAGGPSARRNPVGPVAAPSPQPSPTTGRTGSTRPQK